MVQRRVQVEMPLEGQQVIYVRPQDVIDIQGIKIDELKVDIVGSDVVFTSVYSDAKIVLPGLGIYMFSPDDAPVLRVDGQIFQSDIMLSKVGDVTNVTSSDFITFSEINEEQTTSGEEERASGVASKNEEISAEAQVGSSAEAALYDIAAIVQPIGQTESGNPEQEQIEQQEQIQKEEEREALLNSGNDAGLEARPPNSSSPTPPPQPVPEPVDIPVGNTGNTVFGFTASLVQLGSSEEVQNLGGTDTRVILGGGGSEAATNNTSNAVQISPEIIDTTGENNAHVIYADDPNFFDAATMTRVIRITPSLPSGFDLTNISITGLPVAFDIDGAASDAGGNYSIDNPAIDEDGNIDFVVIYPVPSTQTFTLNFDVTAEFDPLSGVPTPSELTLNETLTQQVNVRDVVSAGDLNFVNGDGDIVWVMANNPNENTIFTGDGDATVFGGVARDVIASADGDDEINAGSGDDFVASGAGNDRIIDADGDDTYEGGDGIADELDYASRNLKIVVDMSVVDGDGYSTVDVGNAESDRIRDIENLITGNQADTLTGSDTDNVIESGDGDDVISGRLGNDILDGGDGFDTADFSYSTLALTVDLGTNIGGGSYAATTAVQNSQLRNVEYVIATAHDDVLLGGAGDDRFDGLAGANSFGWSLGNDVYDATGGEGVLYYEDANGFDVAADLTQDLIFDMTVFDIGTLRFDVSIAALGKVDGVSLDIDTIYAGDGNDTMSGDGDDQVFFGGDGDDILSGRGGADTLDGGDGLDQLFGGADDDFIYANEDGVVDIYDGEAGVDTLILDGVGGDVTLDLAAELMTSVMFGNDTVRGIENVEGTDLIDIIRGDANANKLTGNLGDDTLEGREGNDELIGGSGADYLDGGDDDDILDGGNNDDEIYGGIGDDTLIGGLGTNILDGQGGTDTIDYTGALASVSVDLDSDQVTKSSDLQVDDYADIENILGSNFDDSFIFDAASLIAIDAQFDSLDGGAEDANGDTVSVTGSVTFDGLEMANVFDNIENIDFTTASLDAGNTEFTISGDDVSSMMGATNFLHIDASAGFTIDVVAGTHVLDVPGGTVIDASTTQYTFDGGSFTLEVQTA